MSEGDKRMHGSRERMEVRIESKQGSSLHDATGKRRGIKFACKNKCWHNYGRAAIWLVFCN